MDGQTDRCITFLKVFRSHIPSYCCMLLVYFFWFSAFFMGGNEPARRFWWVMKTLNVGGGKNMAPKRSKVKPAAAGGVGTGVGLRFPVGRASSRCPNIKSG